MQNTKSGSIHNHQRILNSTTPSNFSPYPIGVDSGLDFVILVVAFAYFKLTQVPLQTIIIYRGNIGKAKIACDCPTQGGRCHC